LSLEGVEVQPGERLSIKVMGPDASSGEPGEVLAVASTVGSRQDLPAGPSRKLTFAIPLNEKAAALLANQSKVTLGLLVSRTAGAALKFDRAVLLTGEK
jgi:hypothetical protein